MEEEGENMVSKTRLKPPKGLSEKLRKEAVRLPVKGGEIMLDHKNPLHRMLMDDVTPQNTTQNASHTPD